MDASHTTWGPRARPAQEVEGSLLQQREELREEVAASLAVGLKAVHDQVESASRCQTAQADAIAGSIAGLAAQQDKQAAGMMAEMARHKEEAVSEQAQTRKRLEMHVARSQERLLDSYQARPRMRAVALALIL